MPTSASMSPRRFRKAGTGRRGRADRRRQMRRPLQGDCRARREARGRRRGRWDDQRRCFGASRARRPRSASCRSARSTISRATLAFPTDLEEAAKLIASRKERRVDVAEMNGRIFINNSAIGLYPLMVRDREFQQERLGRSKRLAMLVASVRTLARFGHQRLTLTVNEEKAQRRHPFAVRRQQRLSRRHRRARASATASMTASSASS